MTLRSLERIDGPHRGIEVEFAGTPFPEAESALLLLHGRYGSSKEILGFSRHLAPGTWAFVAPSAAGKEWFPADFQAPAEANEPWLGSALEAVSAILSDLREVGARRLALLGFSQGACLALEFAARNPGRVEAVFGLSGALIGPPGGARSDPPAKDPLRVYLGSHEGDPHIPLAAVVSTAERFRAIGAETELLLHPGSGHSIRPQDIAAVQAFLGSRG